MGNKQRVLIMKRRIKHAKQRIRLRRGLWLKEHEIMGLIEQIIMGESEFLIRFSRNFTLHRVTYKNERFPVIYSKRHKIILTAYQNKWIRKRKNGSYLLREQKQH